MKTIRSLPFLFIFLCLSTFAGAQAGVTLLVKTDMSCNWKLDGQPMGLLEADGPKVVLVSPGEHLIEAASTDGAATVRTKVEVDKVEKTVDIQLKSQNDRQSEMQHDEAAGERAGAALKATWTDPATGLMWTGKDNGSNVDWKQATAYCSKLQQAGYNDWRLPTLEELQGIYDPSISFKVKFDNGVTYNVHVKGNLKLTGWSWSSTQGDGAGQPWQQAWLLNFGIDQLSSYRIQGSMPHNYMTFNYTMRALCVRRPENGVIDQ